MIERSDNGLSLAAEGLLGQLKSLIQELAPEEFSRPLDVLSGSSIGEHCRHCLEFFDCLMDGLAAGIVSYDKRKREMRLGQDRDYAYRRIEEVARQLSLPMPSLPALRLEVSYPISDVPQVFIDTSYERELHYNIEHLVHHMAIIKISVVANFPSVQLPPSFGVSESTLINAAR